MSDLSDLPPSSGHRAPGQDGGSAAARPRHDGSLPDRLNILVLYHATQTFTNTVFEHINAFTRFSKHRHFYCHHDASEQFLVDLSKFDVVVIHYCLRMPYDQVSPQAAQALAHFKGAKVLFMQDEYENTWRAWHWIKALGIDLVFTVVPERSMSVVYPPEQFPGVRFVSNLTGYVPESLQGIEQARPPSTRELVVGYRGRPLPAQYGQLGREKVEIGRLVLAYCDAHSIRCDIAWAEEARIYGDAWYPFIASCRAMLGSESGSNVFDWDFSLKSKIAAYQQAHPDADEDEVHREVVAPLEMPGVMNQISPRIFEAIACRTVLVLFEGGYSGVVKPWKHYLPLAKDGSNLHEVFAFLADGERVDAMAERAWNDVIGSDRYSYPRFVEMTDAQIEHTARSLGSRGRTLPLVGFEQGFSDLSPVTTLPVRWPPPAPAQPATESNATVAGLVVPVGEPPSRWVRLRMAARLLWSCVPEPVRMVLRPVVNGLIRPLGRLAHRLRRPPA